MSFLSRGLCAGDPRKASSALDPPASHAALTVSAGVIDATDSTNCGMTSGGNLSTVWSIAAPRTSHRPPDAPLCWFIHSSAGASCDRPSFLAGIFAVKPRARDLAASRSPERVRAHAASTAATTPALRSRMSDPKSWPSSISAAATWSESAVAPRNAWSTKLALGWLDSARSFPRKNLRKISFSSLGGAARRTASNRCDPLRLSMSCRMSFSSAFASSSPSGVFSSGAHPKNPGTIQFSAAASPWCALSIAWRNALPHASSVRFHSSGSSAASMASANALSSSANLCRSGWPIPESAKAPALLVPPLSLFARLPALDDGEHSRPLRTLRSLRATGDTRGSYAQLTASATTPSAIAFSGAWSFRRRSSGGVLPTLAATHPSACSATRDPKRLLHRT